MLKPSEHASLTCLRLAQLAAAAGLPAGVLNVVSGSGAIAGAALAAHPRLAKLAFTGSGATGRGVAAAAAARLTPLTLELGGKSALLVFDDVDVEKAVEWAMVCTSRTLMYTRMEVVYVLRLRLYSGVDCSCTKGLGYSVERVKHAGPASSILSILCSEQF